MEKYEEHYNRLVEIMAEGESHPREYWKKEVSKDDKRKIMSMCSSKSWNELFHRIVESYNLRYR
jgi:hypothetical protein